MSARKPRLLNLPFLCIVLILLLPEYGYSQTEDIAKYPGRPINFIITSPPGTGSDLAIRVLLKGAEKTLGQPITIVNKPGASGTLGGAAIASAKPDGYTIGHIGHPGVYTASHMQKLPYHPIKDLKWIMQLGYMNIGVTVQNASPFKSLNDVIDYARQNPNKLMHGGAGVGSFGHIAMEQIAKQEGVSFSYLPFKGGPDTEKALLGGHIHVMTGDVSYALIEAGEIRLLALIAENRSIAYPKTPILKDLGYDIPAPTIIGVCSPKGIPEGISRKLEETFTKAMKEEAFIKIMKSLHYTLFYRDSKDLSDCVSRNYEIYGKFLKQMGLAR